MKLIALNKRVIAKVTEVKPDENAMFIPDAAQPQSNEAVIESVGSAVTDVQIGDHIIYQPELANKSSIQGTEYLIIDEEDILAKVGE